MATDTWDEYSIYEVDPANVRRGQEVELTPETPEDLFKRLNERANQEAVAGRGISETERGTLQRAWESYQDWLRAQPAPGPTPVARPIPVVKAVNPPPLEARPPLDDGPGPQGAPEVETSTLVDAHPAAVSARKPTEATVSQKAPLPPEAVVELVTPPPVTDADREALLDRLYRHEAEPGEPHPTHAGPVAREPAQAGEPVELFTGALRLSISDLVVPTAVMPIGMRRCYRSGPPYYGPFGRGWDHAYNVYLRSLTDGSLAFWTGQLQERRFRPAADGGWEPEPGLAVRLERLAGTADVFDLVHPGGLRWRLQRPPGWGNADRIPLAMITDRHGNRVSIAYDPEDRLASVLDEAGRGLHFGYGDCGLLEQVSDHTRTRVVRYDHNDQVEHLERVVLPATAGFPAGIASTYEYDADADHPAMRDNLIRIVDARGRTYLENEYAGPDVGWAFNSVIRQVFGGFEYQFDYEQLQYVPPDEAYVDVPATRTSVAMPDGGLHVYTFNYRGDLLDHRVRLSRDRSYRVVATQYGYDAQGNLTEVTAPDGARQVMRYDAANPDPCARRNLLRTDLVSAVASVSLSRTLVQAHYDARYQLPVRVTDEAGETTRVVYDFDLGLPDATGRAVRVEPPTVTLADNTPQRSTTTLEHNARGQLTAVVSPEGSRSRLDYVVGGIHDGRLRRLVRDESADALTTEFEYDAAGHPRGVSAPGARLTRLRHNALGQREEVTPPAVGAELSSTRFWFDEDGSVARVERPRGDYADPTLADPFLADTFERDVLGHLTATHLATNTSHGRDSHQRADHEGRPISLTDPTDVLTERRHDERGALLLDTRAPGTPDEAITRYSYDRAGRLARVVDASGYATVVQRDGWGRVRSVSRPGGATRLNRWGVRDLLLEVVVEGSPGLGLPARMLSRETYEYDERKRLTVRTAWSFVDDPATAVALTTRYVYDRDDQLRTIRLPRGATIAYAYDGLGRQVLVTDEHGTTRERRYDAAGDLDRAILTEREGGVQRQASWSYEHDARGRVTAVRGPDCDTQFDYDDRDVVVERRQAGVKTRLTPSPFGEVTESTVDPGGLAIRSRFAYDDAGRLSRFTDPTGATTTWEHDRLGRLRVLTLPDGTRWRHDFDLAGHVVHHVTPTGTRVSQVLDANDLPTRLDCAAGPGVDAVPPHEFAYDALGRLVRATLPDGSVACRYDSLGRLIEEESRGRTVRVSYDDLGGAVDLVFPDGRRERTDHDLSGRPTRVILVHPGSLGGTPGAVLAAMSYAAAPVSILHANGVRTSLVYDEPGRLVKIEHARAGVTLDACRVRYDDRSRRALVQVAGARARSTLHAFDANDRLRLARWGFALPELPDLPPPASHAATIAAATAAANTAAMVESYLVDPADSRTQRVRSDSGATATDVYVLAPDHRILVADGHPLAYHHDGHRASDARRQYDVDALGRVVRVLDGVSGASQATFVYDPLGRVTSGNDGGRAFERWFLGTTWIHEIRGAAGDVRQASPHPLWPQPLCVLDGAGTAFPHPDAGLSTMCVTDGAGSVRERHRYGPFGTPEILMGDGVTPLAPAAAALEPRWRAMPLVTAAGLYTSPQRLYDPDLGVFLARDPALYGDSPSPYAYAAHDPVDFADPTGAEKSPLADYASIIDTTLTGRSPEAAGPQHPDRTGLPHVGGPGYGLRYASPTRFTLSVPDSYDFTNMFQYQRAVLAGEIGRNAGPGASTTARRNAPAQMQARQLYPEAVSPRPTWIAPGGRGWALDHLIELQHDLTGRWGERFWHYRWQDSRLNSLEGTQSWQLQRNNPLGAPAGAVVRSSQASFWFNSVGFRQAGNATGTALTVYGAYQSASRVADAVDADLTQGTMGEQTAAAIAHEAAGWAGALAGAEAAAPWGAWCGLGSWFCIPVAGLVGGGIGYWVGSSVADTSIYAGEALLR